MRILVIAAAILLARAACAQDLPGDPAAGRIFALQTCSGCHLVAEDQPDGRIAEAPGFREVAERPGLTAQALFAFLQAPHPTMPSLVLSPEEADDVIAYILSLR